MLKQSRIEKLEKDINQVRARHATRVKEFQSVEQRQRIEAALAIQRLWRGYQSRAKTLGMKKLLELNAKNNHGPDGTHSTQRHRTNPLLDTRWTAEAIERCVAKIKEKSNPHQELFTLKKKLHQQCRLLDELLDRRLQREQDYEFNTMLSSKLSDWISALDTMKENPPFVGDAPVVTAQDPTVSDTIKQSHKKELKLGKGGWWMVPRAFESRLDEMTWNKRDLEFEAWIAQLEGVGIVS